VFIGLSGSTLPEEAIAMMAPGAIAFLLSNPDPDVAQTAWPADKRRSTAR
jgi:malic enzyme